MKTATRWTIVFLTAGLVVLGGLTCWFWGLPSRSLRPYAGPVEKVTISTTLEAKSALLFIAEHKGYFSQNGLEVTLKIFQSGRLGFEQLQAGTIDIANAADIVLVDKIFAGNKSLRCLGAIAADDDIQVIARKDRGILKPEDLRGRRIGVPHGTSAEFFLGRFLTFNNLGLSDIEIVDIQPADLGDALANGKVDAVSIWEPLAYKIEQHLAAKAISWPEQSGQRYYWLLVSTDALVKARPGALERLLRALHQAEIFLKTHREESIEIIAKRLNLNPAIIKDSLIKSKFALSLDQPLFLMMEDEAHWMIKNKLTDQTRLPNYLHFIDAEALAKVNPQAVSIAIPKNKQ